MLSPYLALPRACARRMRAAAQAQSVEVVELAKLASPIAAIALLNMGMSITDTVMVAHLGSSALAAVAVSSDFFSIVFYFSAGVIGGLAPFIAAAVAQKDEAELRKLWLAGWGILAGFASLCVGLIWFAPSLFYALGIDAVLIENGRGYNVTMAFNVLPMLVVAFMRTVLNSYQAPKVSLWITVVALPLNALLNAVLIYGVGGFVGYGILGAGISTCAVSGLVAVAHLAAIRKYVPVPGAGAFRWGEAVRRFVSVLRVGLPIGVTALGELGIFLGATIFVATLGVADAAAHTIAIRVAGVVYAIPLALGQSATVRIAHMESIHGQEGRRTVMSAAVGLSLLTGGALAFALALGAPSVLGVFFDRAVLGPAALEIVGSLLVLLAVMELFEVTGSASSGLMRGRRDTRVPMVYAMVGNWAVAAPLGIYLSLSWSFGAVGVWSALAAGTCITAVMNTVRLRLHWPREGRAPTGATPVTEAVQGHG